MRSATAEKTLACGGWCRQLEMTGSGKQECTYSSMFRSGMRSIKMPFWFTGRKADSDLVVCGAHQETKARTERVTKRRAHNTAPQVSLLWRSAPQKVAEQYHVTQLGHVKTNGRSKP